MKLKKTLLVVLSLMLMVCLSAFTVFSASANDKIVFNPSDIESATEIKENYSLDQEISFPSSITIDYKGASYEAGNGLIHYPSGACYELGSHVLSETGVYTLEYFFEAEGGIKVTAQTNFNVNTTYYNFALDDGSTVTEYATGGSGSQDHVNDLYTTKVGGLKVDIKEGNTFKFNVPIDLRKINNTAKDSSNVVQYSTVGGANEDNELPEFIQYGAGIFAFGSLNAKGEVVEDATSLVSNFFAGTNSGTKIKFRDASSNIPVSFQVFCYNKGKILVGRLTNADGGYDFNCNTEWTVADAVKTTPNIASFNYMRIVVKYNDGRNVEEADKATIYNSLFVYKTSFVSNAALGVMRFTDAYDPSIYVEVLIKTAGSQYWQRARTNHQEDRGFRTTTTNETSSTRTLCFVDGVKYCAYKGDFGKVPNSYTQTKSLYGERISFDLNKHRLYSEQMTDMNKATDEIHLLSDLNNDVVFEGNHFQGFTTGEVYVSFYFESYSKTSSQVIIHKLGDYGVEDLLEWDGKTYEDNAAPTFETEFENTDEFGVYASVGDTVKIPEVKSWDVNAVGDMAVNVYRNYKSNQKLKVNVKDGAFVVGSPDIYTIEYSQKDSAGNVGYYTIDVIGKTAGNGDSISINTQKIESMKAGETVELPAYTISTLNKIENFEMKITASSDRETIVIDNDKMSFVPMYSGTYTITYEFNDNFGTNVFSYEVESLANDTSVVYKELPLLPRYLIKGQKYNIEQAFAYKFETGAPVAENAKMYVVFDNSVEPTLIADPTVTEITGSEQAYFVYDLDGVTYSTQIIPIIDATYYENGNPAGIDMYKYFDGNFVYNDRKADDPTKREGNIVYFAQNGARDMSLKFINHVDYNNFAFKYQVRPDYSKFTSIKARIFGVKNPSEEIILELVREGAESETEKVSLYLNGKFHSVLNNYAWTDAKTKTIGYSKSTNTILVGGISIMYPWTVDGMLIDFDITIGGFYGENGQMGMMVTNVGNQKFSGTTYKDGYAPTASVITSQGEYNIGEEVTLELPVYNDILSQVDPSTLVLSVSDDDGNFATSKDNVLLDGNANAGQGVQYTIVFDKITNYHVDYAGYDYAGNKVSLTYIINVIDFYAPEIKLTSVKEGQTYKMDKWGTFDFTYEVTDNLSQTSNITVSVVLYNVDNGVWRNNVGTSFKCYYAGSYRVQVLAQDEAGNFSAVYFYIEAE